MPPRPVWEPIRNQRELCHLRPSSAHKRKVETVSIRVGERTRRLTVTVRIHVRIHHAGTRPRRSARHASGGNVCRAARVRSTGKTAAAGTLGVLQPDSTVEYPRLAWSDTTNSRQCGLLRIPITADLVEVSPSVSPVFPSALKGHHLVVWVLEPVGQQEGLSISRYEHQHPQSILLLGVSPSRMLS